MADLTFDKAAAAYDRFMGRWSRLYIPSLVSALQLRPGDRVLDVAAGTGEAALACTTAVGEHGIVIASDVSVAMLRIARAKAPDQRIVMLASEGQGLACAPASFDAVICVLGLMFFPDPLAGLKEMHRVLRPGGRLALSVWATPDRVPLVTIMLEALVHYLPDERQAIGKAFSLSDPRHLASLMEGAGFAEVSVTRATRELAFESFEDYWGPVEDGGSRASAPYRELPRDAQESIRAEVRRRLGVFASGGRFLMEVDMLFAIGRR
jgi:ubiquinone/menaquinone biosynthesis C-methylase UbiE